MSEDVDDPGQRWTGRASVTPPASPVSANPVSPSPVSRTPSASGRAQIVDPRRPVSPPPRPAYTSKKRLKPRWGRIALVASLALLLVVGLGAVITYGWLSGVNSNLKRTDPFAGIADRPPVQASGALNFLLLGSDSRDPDAPVDQPGKWRTDTIVLMHIPASHDKAYLISFPRDLWVFVPKSKTSPYGGTMAKINAAYAWGGLPLMVETVEGYTGVRMDHVALIDFAGFVRVVNAVGGVDMNVERTITSIHPPHRTFTKGANHFNGAEALDYIRQRKQFPDGDFARMRHQQQFLKALLDKATSAGVAANPLKLKNFVTSIADAVTVDPSFSLLDLGWQFRSLKSQDLSFMTSPYTGTGNINGESVVLGDKQKALSLFDAVSKDTVSAWVAAASPSKATGG
jgi:LCP family protein required for cell wall assembly